MAALNSAEFCQCCHILPLLFLVVQAQAFVVPGPFIQLIPLLNGGSEMSSSALAQHIYLCLTCLLPEL